RHRLELALAKATHLHHGDDRGIPGTADHHRRAARPDAGPARPPAQPAHSRPRFTPYLNATRAAPVATWSPAPSTHRRGKGWRAMRWKPALNAFDITFGDRFPAPETY